MHREPRRVISISVLVTHELIEVRLEIIRIDGLARKLRCITPGQIAR